MRRGGPEYNVKPTANPAPVEKPKPRHEALNNEAPSKPKPRPEADLPSPSVDLILEVELLGWEAELAGLEAVPLAKQDTGRIKIVKAAISGILRKLGR